MMRLFQPFRNRKQLAARANYDAGVAAMQPKVTSLQTQVTRLDQFMIALDNRIGQLSPSADLGRVVSDATALYLSGESSARELVAAVIEAVTNSWHMEETIAETQRALSVEAQVEHARLIGERLLKEARQVHTDESQGFYAAAVRQSFP